MEKPNRPLVVTFLTFTLISNFFVEAVEIRRISVPKWVQNGTDSVILDCEYVYNENDIRLVVKWFFNDNLEPVYQWIPELNMRHTSGILQGRLDLNFSVNTVDAYSRYRALKVLNPTTELSGKYTCLVTSLAGQDSREQNMTVYVPAATFDVNYIETGKDLNLTCEAQGLYPRPNLRLYLLSSGETMRQQLEAKKTVEKQSHGVYNIQLHRMIPSLGLQKSEGSVFECQLEIQGSTYTSTKRIAYYPGIARPASDMTRDLTAGVRVFIPWSKVWITTLAITVPMIGKMFITAASPICKKQFC
ncbi:uncharacterized protein [Centruroides vittatus]|uniref:uncharacterized protein n=1 Tax=Centruroides vittatus TaxID=120091 RepID=UPI003510AC16